MPVTFQEHRLGSLNSLGAQVALPATYTINIWVKNVTLPGQEWSNLYLQNSGSKYVLDANYGAIGTGTAPRLAAGASSPLQVAGTWHLVSAVYNGSTMEYYVNGVSIGSITPASPPSVIDVLNGPAGQEFAAEVKDMRVYSGVATAGEILASFNNGDGDLLPLTLTDSLVAKYALDTDATDSVSSNDLSASGTVSYDVDGDHTAAFFSSGELVSTNTIDLTGQATVSFWAKAGTSYSYYGNNYESFFRWGTHAGSHFDLYLLNGKIRALHNAGNGWVDNRGSVAVPAGWNHYAITIDPSNGSKIVYLNGVAQALTGAAFSGTFAASQQIWLGNISTQPPFRSNGGRMDDTRIWTRVLSASEIAGLHAAGAEPYVPLTLADGLVAKYDLDYNADDSVGTSNGTASNITFAADGAKRHAVFERDNSATISVPSGVATAITGDHTISAWLRLETINGYYTILTANQEGLGLIHGKPGFLSGGGTLTFNNALSALNTNTWYHIAMTKSGSTKTLYVNGSAQANGTDTSTSWGFGSNVQIGRGSWADGANGYLDGDMDDHRVWSRALSASEISSLYAAGAEPYVPPSGEYDFSHGGNISGVVEFISTTDSNGSRTYLYIRNENGSTGLSVTSDPKSYNEFSSIAPISTGITGKPLGGCSGAGGEAFMFTDANKIYKITFGANHIFLLATELAGAHDVQELRYENDSLIACCNNGQIKVSAAGEALSTVLDLSAEYQPGTVAVDIAGASEGWCIISKNSDNTFNAAIVSSDWNTVYKNAQLNIPISALEINYYAQEGLWKASDGSSVVTTDDITNWLA